RMRDLTESQQQVLDQTLAIDCVSECLSHLDIVERRRRRIDRQQVHIRSAKHLHLQVRITPESLHCVRRETRWHWCDINTTRLQLRLECVHVGNYAHAHGRQLRRAFPVLRKRLNVTNLLRVVVMHKLEWTSAQRMGLL